MENTKRINSEIILLGSLSNIAQVYQESSIFKIKNIRSSVVNTREFLNKLSGVYYDVKQANTKKLTELIEKKHHITDQAKADSKNADQSGTAVPKLQKTLIILLSANTKLYGEIVQETFKVFIETIKNEKEVDIMIVGKLGEKMLKEAGYDRPHLFFEIPDTNLSAEDLKPLMFHIVKYEKVVIYHGKFYNLMNQRPTTSNITGQALFEEGNVVKSQTTNEKFIFEPSLEILLQFFENQIFATLFRQTVAESELARYASRVNAMEDAVQSIKKRHKMLTQEGRRMKRMNEQKKQSERFAGMRLWKG